MDAEAVNEGQAPPLPGGKLLASLPEKEKARYRSKSPLVHLEGLHLQCVLQDIRRKGQLVSQNAARVAELLAEVENSRPVKDAFQFSSLSGCLERAGKYTVVYTMAPSRPTLGPLSASVELNVTAGPPAQMSVQVVHSTKARQAISWQLSTLSPQTTAVRPL